MKATTKIAVNVGLIFISVLIAILLLEVVVRVFLQTHPYTNFYEYHKQLGRFFIPGRKGYNVREGFNTFIEINSKGLRDEEHSYEKPDGSFRILVLGDSFGAAFEVSLEDTFYKMAQKLLNKSTDSRKFEIINGSYPGWGTAKQLLFFQVEGFKYQPDLVLLIFYPGNDVLDNAQIQMVQPHLAQRISGRQKAKVEKISYYIKTWLTENTRFYPYMNMRLKSSAPMWFLNFLQKVGLLGTVSPLVQAHIPSDYLVYASVYSQDWENAWLITRKLINNMRSEIEKHNAKFAVVIITDREQVHPDCWQEALTTYSAMKLRKWDLNKPNRLLTGFLQKEKIPYLDLLPLFRNYVRKNGKYLHYRYDGHWNVEGHHLAGQHISKWLVEDALLIPVKKK